MAYLQSKIQKTSQKIGESYKRVGPTTILVLLQQIFKDYINDNELFRTKELLNDNTVIYSMETYKSILNQDKMYKKLKKIYRRAQKSKKYLSSNFDIDEEIANLVRDLIDDNKDLEYKNNNSTDLTNLFIEQNGSNVKSSLSTSNIKTNVLREKNIVLGKRYSSNKKEIDLSPAIEFIKKDLEQLKDLPEYVPRKFHINRNLTQSVIHNQFLSKLDEFLNQPKKASGTFINQSMVFQNGVATVSPTQKTENQDDKNDSHDQKTKNLFFSTE